MGHRWRACVEKTTSFKSKTTHTSTYLSIPPFCYSSELRKYLQNIFLPKLFHKLQKLVVMRCILHSRHLPSYYNTASRSICIAHNFRAKYHAGAPVIISRGLYFSCFCLFHSLPSLVTFSFARMVADKIIARKKYGRFSFFFCSLKKPY